MSTQKHILKRIRQRYELDGNDSSKDAEIDNLPPIQKLREVVSWEFGDPDWANQILELAKSCGIEVDV